MMKQPNSKANLEQSISRYVRALDAGNLDEIAAIMQIAEDDAELDRSIGEINWAYAEELGLSSNSLESDQIRNLLKEHFPSAFSETNEMSMITVSEVAAHLVANRLVPFSDQASNMKLLSIHIPLPSWLSLPEIRKLSQQLSLSVSERFLKLFHDTAIQISMGRGQARMTAARRKSSRRRSGSDRPD